MISTASLAFGVVILVTLAAAAIWIERRGRISERAKQQGRSLDAVDEAKDVARDVARESDPVKRLRDKWRRPVPGERTDPDKRG